MKFTYLTRNLYFNKNEVPLNEICIETPIRLECRNFKQ